jgi:hypothetical protein
MSEKLVNKGGFAMIKVGNDRNVSNQILFHLFFLPGCCPMLL